MGRFSAFLYDWLLGSSERAGLSETEGRLLFLEHVRSEEPRLARWLAGTASSPRPRRSYGRW